MLYIFTPYYTVRGIFQKRCSMFQRNFNCKLIQVDKIFDIAKLKEKEPDLFDDLVKDYPTDDKNILICLEKDKNK